MTGLVARGLFAFAIGVAWGGVFAAPCPLPEHPRPDWSRPDWVNLNGAWRFAFDKSDAGRREKWQTAGDGKFPLSITVPFGWGSPLSGVGDEADVAWYRRAIRVPEAWKGRRVFLVFGASDRETTVWLGNVKLGVNGIGFLPFEYDITDYVKWGEKQPVTCRVDDRRHEWAAYAKQGYGNTRGIWQTPYLEARGWTFVDRVRFTPHLKDGTVGVEVSLGRPAPGPKPHRVTIALAESNAADIVNLDFRQGEFVAGGTLRLRKPRLWTLDDPHLYKVRVTSGGDEVDTYFGFREIGRGHEPFAGHPYVTLNGQPVYLQLVLDQGVCPQGHYTFPSDEFIRRDLELVKSLGLNGIRTHVKAEIPRKLYWADRMGLLVMSDVPNFWGEATQEAFLWHRALFDGMVERDFNHPSVFAWVLFNEDWGTTFFDVVPPAGDWFGGKRYSRSVQIAVMKEWRHAKESDPTRLVEDMSPYMHDHVVTDINTWHRYRPAAFWEQHAANVVARTFPGSDANYVNGQFQDDIPMLNSECGNVWGYKGSAADSDWSWDYHGMINAFRRRMKISGWCYTEHHDVPREWNGYVRYDRTMKHPGFDGVFPGMTLRDLHAPVYLPLDNELCRIFKGGETYKVPVDVSMATSLYAGKPLELLVQSRWYDALGCAKTSTVQTARHFEGKAWQAERLATVPVELPRGTTCGAACFSLKCGDETIARNFTCFITEGASDRKIVSVPAGRPARAEWSGKTWKTLGGLKINGTGSGFFEYEFDTSAFDGGVKFLAELSPKRLFKKDSADARPGADEFEFVAGSGMLDRTANPNSYPMTDDRLHPGRVRIYANGELVAIQDLPDDPADHRGILSWASQVRTERRNMELRDAGSYGYLVTVDIPARILRRKDANAEKNRLLIRLEAEGTGLAVYGAKFGRYPLDPEITNAGCGEAEDKK